MTIKDFRFLTQHPFFKKILKWAAYATGALVLLFALIFILVLIEALGPVPDRQELESMENPLATEVYSADSVLLGRFFIQERSQTQYDKISPHVIHSLIATEDVRFYKHNGIDWRSLARVIVKSILFQRESSGGGSTITQQLVKNYYPRRSYFIFSLLINKIRENIIATRLEKIYTKEEILALYLNTVPFGDNTYGIETAANRFFSVSSDQLSLPEAAVLVGMLKATYSYNPRVFPDRAFKRRNVVMNQLLKYDFITDATHDSLTTLPIELRYNKVNHNEGLAPYFRSYVQQQVASLLNGKRNGDGENYNMYTDGLKIYTTLDSKLQQYAEEAVSNHMSKLQKEFDNHWQKSSPWQAHPEVLQKAIRNSNRYLALKKGGMSEPDILKEMDAPVLTNVFTWNGEKEMMMSPIDSIKHYLMMLNTGVLAMDKTGNIKVWVGGIDHHHFQFDHVRESTKRQVGSTFKPVVYAAALEEGIKPCDYISAQKTVYTDVKNWTPENGHENYDLKYSMAGGLAYSVNTVSVRLLEETGIDNTIALARRMGITSEIPSVPSIALGTPSISVEEMVTAYVSFINGGRNVTPVCITKITDQFGKVLVENEPVGGDQAMEAEHARMMVEMLKGAVDNGTASALRTQYGLKNDIGGKTGTTQSNSDGWFMAVTPELVVGTWVGADDPSVRFRSTALGQGAHMALPVFARFYQKANADKALNHYTKKKFEPLNGRESRLMSCEFFKDDANFVEKLFGKNEAEVKEKKFGEKEKKKGFFKRLFGN